MAKHNNPSEKSSEEKPKVTRQGLKKALKVYQFILPYRYTFSIGLVFLALSTLTSLAVPFLAGQFLDVALGNTFWIFDSIRKVLYIFTAILLLQAIFSFFRIYLFAIVSEKSMADIRANLYGKIISLPISFFEQKRVGELNSRITSDVTQLQDALSFTIAEFLRQVATILIGIVILFVQSTELTLFMVATFPVLVFLAVFFGRYIRKLSKQAQDELASSTVIVEETFQAVQAVKAFTNELFELNRYRNSLDKVVKTSLKVAKNRGAFASFIIAVLFGGIMMVLAYGANLVEAGKMLPGELTSFIIYTAFIGGSLGGMSELYGKLQKAVGASERILEILDEPSEVEVETIPQTSSEFVPLKGQIEFKNVKFFYPTRPDIQVLDDISFKVDIGQKIALVGHSGAGKSTIVQLLSNYYPIQEGGILVDAQNVQDLDVSYLRQNIGIVPQEVILFGGTIRENIAYGRPQASDEEIKEAARRANALSFIESFPESLDTLVGERGVKLSGGQRQRVAIARAILKNPSILILDEATSSLDADSEKLVQEALDELMQNRTTIIIAHRLATIRKVDQIYVINEGKIQESGNHEELISQTNGIYSNLVKLQFEIETKDSDSEIYK